MSTQNSGHRPTAFSISTPFQHVRLLEVPNDLLEAITDSSQSLKFKSSSISSKATSAVSGSSSGHRDGIVHLCSADKAWAVKQVSTSNSVYLIKPTPAAAASSSSTSRDVNDRSAEDADTAMDMDVDMDTNTNTDVDSSSINPQPDLQPASSVSAIAQASSFLELHAVPINEAAIEAKLTSLLPIYDPQVTNIDLDLQRHNNALPRLTMSELIDEIPVPDAIVVRCISHLVVFETTFLNNTEVAASTSTCAIPSTRAMLKAWTRLCEEAACEAISLDSLASHPEQLLDLIRDEPDAAILRRMFGFPSSSSSSSSTREDDVSMFDTLSLYETTTTISSNTSNNNNGNQHILNSDSAVKKKRWNTPKLCRFLASLLLSAAPDRQLETETFLAKWMDLVSVSSVKTCTMDILLNDEVQGGEFSLSQNEQGKEIVKWNGAVDGFGLVYANMLGKGVRSSGAGGGADGNGKVSSGGSGSGSGSGSAAGTTAGNAAADKKRKWHEKFGAQRNLKK